MRMTVRLSKSQHTRIAAVRNAAAQELGQRVSWQLAFAKILEAGLRGLGYPPCDGAELEGVGDDDSQG